MLTNRSLAPSPAERLASSSISLSNSIARHEVQPLLIPQLFASFALLFVYLCIPHNGRGRRWLYQLRWAVFGIIVWRELGIIGWRPYSEAIKMRTLGTGFGFGIGLISFWTIIASATWLIWDDPQVSARRIERKKTLPSTCLPAEKNGTTVPHEHGSRSNEHASPLRRRPDGQLPPEPHLQSKTGDDDDWTYYWQSYPVDSLWTRVEWVADLILNFRGPGWNWEITTNPGPPSHVRESLGQQATRSSATALSSAGIVRYDTRSALLRTQLPRLIIGYITLDVLKVLLMKDPYFVHGNVDYALPNHLSWLSPTALAFYRRMLSCTSVVVALESTFLLAPLAFSIILGPRYLGIRGEPWMYPTTWGSLGYVCNKGLAGLWGGWWHQTFRKGFSAPTDFLIRNGFISQSSNAAKVFGLFVAFGTSGALHAAGSYTAYPDSRPWDLVVFFMLQAVGIMLQEGIATALKTTIRALPSWLRKAGNLGFAAAWVYITSPYLVDDFSRSVWMFEPVPFSLLRGLGFGHKDESWLVMIDPFNLRWHSGRTWWESGFSF